jgi:hypothetical protein
VVLHDLVGDEKPQARSLGPLGREEHAEGFVLGLLIHADAVVLDFENRAVAVHARLHRHLAGNAFGAEPAGVDGVFQDVDQQRVNGVLVALEDAARGRHPKLDPVGARPALENFPHGFGDLVDLDGLPVDLSVLRVVEDVHHHASDPIDLALDHVPALLQPVHVVVLEARLHQIYAAVQTAEQPFDAVGDGAHDQCRSTSP